MSATSAEFRTLAAPWPFGPIIRESSDDARHYGAGKIEGGKQDGTEQNAARHQNVDQQPCVRPRRGGEQEADPEAADDGNTVEQPLDDDRCQPPYPRQAIGLLEEFGAKKLAQPRRHDGVQPVADEQRPRYHWVG